MPKFHPFHKLRSQLFGIKQNIDSRMVPYEVIREQIDRLWRDLKDNVPIRELAHMEGWRMLDAYQSKKIADMLKDLPRLVLQNKHAEAVAAAAYIEAANDILGLVNRTLYDSELSRQFVDSLANMGKKLEEKRNAGK